MSKEPGVCDSYVKVCDELEVGWGVVRDRITGLSPKVPAHLWASGHSRWQLRLHHLVSRRLLSLVTRP